MTDAFLTLPPNSGQVWGYPSGQNIKFFPIFLLVASHLIFWTYQSSKKLVWVSGGGGGGGGGVHGDRLWPMDII